jgi:hypothetical protein
MPERGMGEAEGKMPKGVVEVVVEVGIVLVP